MSLRSTPIEAAGRGPVGRVSKATICVLSVLAMVAFAGNSLLCRIALKETSIDAATFTTLRLTSGTAVLLLFARCRASGAVVQGDWMGALVLVTYAFAFSFAYEKLTAGTGALLLFGGAQAAMIGYGVWIGERFRGPQVLGIVIAIAGLVALLLPGLAAPPYGAAILMIGSGLAWGTYSLLGRSRGDPIATNAGYFIRALPIAVVVSLAWSDYFSIDTIGALCAAASGAVTSGVGYIIWYTVVREITATSASTMQLSVPAITAIAGGVLLAEPLSLRLIVSSIATLGGIGLFLFSMRR